MLQVCEFFTSLLYPSFSQMQLKIKKTYYMVISGKNSMKKVKN
ncbi:MAG: hypothetical protein RHS_5876 [Robinsoniella sp. RHS]|nr:MAG: hypothetical protein RHS_5876 [Robinsoniella sp. RHS]